MEVNEPKMKPVPGLETPEITINIDDLPVEFINSFQYLGSNL